MQTKSLLLLTLLALVPVDGYGDQPNFVFILTDDQAQQTLGCYGNTVCNTANIDRIAKSGMLIRDAHHMGSWSGAVCLPSRTMIMTGQSVWRLPNYRSDDIPKGEFKKVKSKREVEAAKISLPALFNAAGYDTMRTCKRGNTFKAANRLFDVRHDDRDMRQGNDEQGSRWHADHVMKFLKQRELTKESAPFFVFMGFSHPHDPRNGKPELLKKYGAINCKKPPTLLNPNAPKLPVNYLPAHPFHHGHPGLRDEVKVAGVLKDRSEMTVRNEIGREYACIENIDQQIGRVLDQLDSMGVADNTYVIFTSDHGIAVGRHGLMGKQNLYEHTWSVPFLISGPGIQARSSASGFIYLMDVLPTVCELAGIQIPEGIDGKSFKQVLTGKKQRIRDVVYGTYSGGTKPGIRSVKSSDGWKLIKYDVLDGKVQETQLFNLKSNPNEFIAEHRESTNRKLTGSNPGTDQTDLAELNLSKPKLQEMESKLLEQMRIYGDPYRLWDQE